MQNYNSRPESWVQRNMKRLVDNNETALTVCLLFESMNILFCFHSIIPSRNIGCNRIEPMLRKFIADEEPYHYRNARFKMVPRIAEAPWYFKKLVPHGAVIVANQIPTSYYQTERYLE